VASTGPKVLLDKLRNQLHIIAMKFFDEVGKMAMGTRVRFLGDKITQDASEIYQAYGTDLQPKWFPVFYVLSKNGEDSVTSIAEHIGHSHASVSKIITEMSKANLLVEKTDSNDRRRTKVTLSKKGREIAQKIEEQYVDVNAAIEDISAQASHNLWAAIEEWEYLLSQKSLRDRVLEMKKQRESMDVKIEPYQPKYKDAFYKLNEEWITKYFKMEKPDRDALDNPKGYILDKGGFIFVATVDKEPVGVCALLKRDDLNCYELAKMAVSPKAQGKNIGFLLGKAVVDKAVSLKAKRLFLESNTILKPALRLYEKLGFKKIVGPPTPYERCNIQMELILQK
jgi:DNA-binding MarR family transcriptional regulator/GNAT superfamily N-acetyltransferase